jgi:hypothetical protein
MQLRLFTKGSVPPPSADGVVNDISSKQVPQVGDCIQLEGMSGEVVRRYRVVSRVFRSPLTGESTEVALEVEPIALGEQADP